MRLALFFFIILTIGLTTDLYCQYKKKPARGYGDFGDMHFLDTGKPPGIVLKLIQHGDSITFTPLDPEYMVIYNDSDSTLTITKILKNGH